MKKDRSPHLFWLYSGSGPLSRALDAATWIEITRELREAGWTVSLAASEPSGRTTVDGVEVLPLPRPDVYLVGQVVFGLRFLGAVWRSKDPIDVVMIDPIAVGWIMPLRLVRWLRAAKLPLLVVDWRSLHMIDREHASIKDHVRGWFYRMSSTLSWIGADGQLTITHRLADALEMPAEVYWGAWPSGVRPEPFAAAARDRRWPTGDEQVNLVYIGSLRHERHLDELCSAVLEANRRGARFVLRLVGKGPAAADLRERAAHEGGAIIVSEPVPHDAVASILADSHVGVLPFPDEETFRVSSPIKLFEYFAARLPVFATRIVCHTDVIGQSPCAFWAEDATVAGLGAGLYAIWEERSSLATKGRAAGEQVPNWTWRAAADKLRTSLQDRLDRVSAGARP